MKICLVIVAAVICFAFCAPLVFARDSTVPHSAISEDDMMFDPRQPNTSNPCVWAFNKTGESNHTYDLSNARGLTKDYNLTYQGNVYILNVCQATLFACKTANSPTGQRNSIGCQPGAAPNSTYSIGQLLQFNGSEIDGKYLQINYTQGTPVAGSSPTVYRRMVIKYQCSAADPGNYEITSIDLANGAYFLTFSSKWSCPVGGSVPSGGGGNGSAFDVGFIIIIAVVGALVLYFIVGAIVNKAILKKEGIEIIPNVGFWTELPSLIKDGFLFVYYKIRGRGYSSV